MYDEYSKESFDTSMPSYAGENINEQQTMLQDKSVYGALQVLPRQPIEYDMPQISKPIAYLPGIDDSQAVTHSIGLTQDDVAAILEQDKFVPVNIKKVSKKKRINVNELFAEPNFRKSSQLGEYDPDDDGLGKNFFKSVTQAVSKAVKGVTKGATSAVKVVAQPKDWAKLIKPATKVLSPITNVPKSIFKPVTQVAQKAIKQVARTEKQAVKAVSKAAKAVAKNPLNIIPGVAAVNILKKEIKPLGQLTKAITSAEKTAVKATTSAVKAIAKAPTAILTTGAGLIGAAAGALTGKKTSADMSAPTSESVQTGTFQYIDSQGRLTDEYGNVSPTGPVAGETYYDYNGNPVGANGQPLTGTFQYINASGQLTDEYGNVDPNGPVSGQQYYDYNGNIVDNTGAIVPETSQQVTGTFQYINSNGQLTDEYGNVSPTPADPSQTYYDYNGNVVDASGQAVTDTSSSQVIDAEFSPVTDESTSQETSAEQVTGTFQYINSNGQLTDEYGNVSSTPPDPNYYYYNYNGNMVDSSGAPVQQEVSSEQTTDSVSASMDNVADDGTIQGYEFPFEHHVR